MSILLAFREAAYDARLDRIIVELDGVVDPDGPSNSMNIFELIFLIVDDVSNIKFTSSFLHATVCTPVPAITTLVAGY